MTLWLCAVFALVAALVTAALLHRRSPHLPAVLALAWGLLVDLVVGTRDKDTGAGCGLAQLLAHRPWSPADRALYHASNALVSSWPTAVAALAWWVLAPAHRRRAMPILGAGWMLANLVLVSGPLTIDRVQGVLLVVQIAVVLACGLAIAVGWGGPRWRALQGVVVALAGTELVILLAGPYRYSVFERWDLAQICYLLSFAALAVAQVIAWRRLRPPQAGPSPS